jgi:hypothetical protein
MDQLVLSHKKLTNNMMEFNNSRSHSTLLIKKNLMTTRISTIQTSNQIKVLTVKLNLTLLSKLIQMLLLEKLELTTKLQTMPSFQEDHIWSKPMLELLLSEKCLIDGKETTNILVQLNFQLLKQPLLLLLQLLLSKRRSTQMIQLD